MGKKINLSLSVSVFLELNIC